MRLLIAITAGVFGLPIGSFLTVVIYRVPRGASIVAPRSRCPTCGFAIRGRDNLPVISYLLRRGRCGSCGEAISPRYLVIEVVTAALFFAVALRTPSPWMAPAYCTMAAGLVGLSAIDIEFMRLPTKVIHSVALIGFPLLVLASALTSRWIGLVHAAVAGIACFGVFLAIFAAAPKGFGRGDVRLAGLCGVFLGWMGYRTTTVGFLLSFVLGGLVALALIATGRVRRSSRLPFGPFLSAGALGAVLVGPQLGALWLR